MPIVSYNNHPSLVRVGKEGFDVISADMAKHQDIRELHIGFLNMMPDAAFLATERQFFRLITSATNIVQIYIHPIKCKGIKRNYEIGKHINTYYQDFDKLKKDGLDAIIVTGANPQFKDLTDEPYWQNATDIFNWADKHVCSVFFSCLASHAVLQEQYGLKRSPLTEKLWGIYSHRVIDSHHPLVANINTRFDMPHSRANDIHQKLLLKKSLKVLVTSNDSGVAIATSKDGFRKVFCQGHPEYDTSSLLKEYKREVTRFINKDRKDYPQIPKGYITKRASKILLDFKDKIIKKEADIYSFPYDSVIVDIDNTWRDTAKSIFSNWLSLVYRTTHIDRNKTFMDGIDPNYPIKQWYNR